MNLISSMNIVPCPKCNRTFKTFSQLKSHVNGFHHGSKDYFCPIKGCGQHYTLFNSFGRHFKRQHFSLSENSNVVHVLTDNSFPVLSQAGQHEVPDVLTVKEPKNLIRTLAKCCAGIYEDPKMPQKMGDVFFQGIEKVVGAISEDTNMVLDNGIKETLSMFSSEDKRLAFFINIGTFIPPSPFVVGPRLDLKTKLGRPIHTNPRSFAHVISLGEVLKKFFSLEGILVETLSFMRSTVQNASTKSINHFLNGSSWQSRSKLHGDKIVIPFFMHIGFVECSRGSHSAHKIGAVHVSIAGLPPKYQEELECIFLLLLFHANDAVKYGNLAVFHPLIKEFNILIREGIYFDVPNFRGRVFFELALVLGDNLSLRSVMGWVESFAAKYLCRTCKVDRDTMKTQMKEDFPSLRTMENHLDDLQVKVENGTKEKCVWLKLDNFNLFQQTGVNIMNDLEGILNVLLGQVIQAFIKKKFFTLELVNNKIKGFDFGSDSSSKPKSLSLENLRRANLRLPASEVFVLFRYFGVLFGPLVPEEDQVWALYINFQRIVEIIMAPMVWVPRLPLLNSLISEFLDGYCRIFKTGLKPPFHNLLHYSRFMLAFGPLTGLGSKTFEAKLGSTELARKSTCDRSNVTLTLANKHQFKLNNLLLSEKLLDHLTLGPLNPVTDGLVLSHLGCEVNDKVESCSWASIGSYHFKQGTIVVYKIEPEEVIFLKISHVYFVKNKIAFSGHSLYTLHFQDHYFAYEVEMPDDDDNEIFVYHDDLPSPKPCHISHNGYGCWTQYFVVLRQPL